MTQRDQGWFVFSSNQITPEFLKVTLLDSTTNTILQPDSILASISKKREPRIKPIICNQTSLLNFVYCNHRRINKSMMNCGT